MMCRYANLFLIIGILYVSAKECTALEKEASPAGEGDKAVHGVINTLTFPLEFPMQAYKGYQHGLKGFGENPSFSRFTGTLWGFIGPGTHKAAGRLWLGLYQLGGFWMLNPISNEGYGFPLDGEYAFDFDDPFQISLGNGFKLISNKLRRGLLNIYWGSVAELPGNTLKGIQDHTPIKGFLRGSWYMMSRLWQGISDTGGILLPNTQQTTGYTFDVDDPWNKRPEPEDDFQFSSAHQTN